MVKKRNMGEICHKIANDLLKQYKFKTITGKKGEEIFVYSDGIYEQNGRDIIKGEVEKLLGPLAKTHNVNEVINKIARKSIIKREELGNNNVNLICLNNGVLDLKNMELKSHSSRYCFTSKVPVDYNEKLRCSAINDFLYDILYEDDIPIIQEWIGYCLYRNYMVKKGMIFVGEGDTGKTTLLNLIAKFVGVKNISSLSLQKLSNDKFASAHLYNKHVNIYDDLSSTDVADTGSFKIATGGGLINAEFKFGDQFQFVNHSKLTFATNKIPNIKKDGADMTYYKRWIVLMFESIFDETNKRTDKNLINKLSTKKEMSGLLNWALVGLKRLLDKEKFSYNKDMEEIKRIIQRSASDIARFTQDSCHEVGGEWISKEDMYEHYKEYNKLNSLPIVTKEKFGRSMTKVCSFIVDSRQGTRTGWRNVTVDRVKKIGGF